MDLVQELNTETYDQYIAGTKCIRLNSDLATRTYQSTLPSVGVAATLDLAQALTRVNRFFIDFAIHTYLTTYVQKFFAVKSFSGKHCFQFSYFSVEHILKLS